MSEQRDFQIQVEGLIQLLARTPHARPDPRFTLDVDRTARELRISDDGCGTRLTLHVGPEHARYLDIELIKKADFNGVPVSVNDVTQSQPSYLSCAVTLPEGEPRSEEIFAALRSVLEAKPYYWQVVRADSPPADSDLPLDLDEPPARAALNVTVFAGPTLNQGLINEVSIGQILGLPQLILCDEGHPELPLSFDDVPRKTVGGFGSMLREGVSAAVSEHPEVCHVRPHERYLSPAVLAWCAGLDEGVGSAISARYPTWPEFLSADSAEVARVARIDVTLVEAAKSGLRRLAEEA